MKAFPGTETTQNSEENPTSSEDEIQDKLQEVAAGIAELEELGVAFIVGNVVLRESVNELAAPVGGLSEWEFMRFLHYMNLAVNKAWEGALVASIYSAKYEALLERHGRKEQN